MVDIAVDTEVDIEVDGGLHLSAGLRGEAPRENWASDRSVLREPVLSFRSLTVSTLTVCSRSYRLTEASRHDPGVLGRPVCT